MISLKTVLEKCEVEADLHRDGERPDRWNNIDLVPLPPHRRTWGYWAFAGFWAVLQVNSVNWQTGSSLLDMGLSVWEAMIAVIIGKILIGLVAVFNGWIGAEWHIGFTVTSRAVFGMYGMYLPLIQRIFLCLVWFGVQSWIGGQLMQVILTALFPSYRDIKNGLPASANMTTPEFVAFIVFVVLQFGLMWIRPEKTITPFRIMTFWSAITMCVVTIWALAHAHGTGPILTQSSTISSASERGWTMIRGITTVIGSICVSLSNQPDFSRFAKFRGAQVPGQLLSSLLCGTLICLCGILTSAACQKMYGELIWSPAALCLKWMENDYNSKSRTAAVFVSGGFMVSQVMINLVDNAWPGGFDLAGLFPTVINIKRGAYIACALSICLNPWQFINSSNTFINVLDAYSVFLGPLTGVYVCDYFMVRRRRIKLSDLYTKDKSGIYWFNKFGVNYRAYVSWIAGWVPTFPGFLVGVGAKIKISQGASDLFYLAYIFGFTVSFTVHYAINYFFPPRGLGEIDSVDVYKTFTPSEAASLGITKLETIEATNFAEGSTSSEKGTKLSERVLTA